MALIGKGAQTRISIDGIDVQGVEDNAEIAVLISFENGAVQGNATTEALTFVRDARAILKDRIARGIVFEGAPITIQVSNIDSSQSIFDGYIDVSNAEIDDSIGRLSAPIVKSDGLQSLDARLSAISFGYLEDIGAITDADYVDIDYEVESLDTAFESFVVGVVKFLMLKALYDEARATATNIATSFGIAASSLTGPIGGAVASVLNAAATIAYGVALLVTIITLGRDFIDFALPRKRMHKAITFRTAFEKICAHLGYVFQSSIAEMANVTYLPSNNTPDTFGAKGFISRVGTITKGIPKANDYGYNCNEFFALGRTLFNLKFAVVGGAVVAETDTASYWIRQSSYVMPSILAPKFSYNAGQAVANKSFNFATDLKDEYTITNYRGTSYQVTLRPKVVVNPKNVALKGFEDVNFNIALANRKDTATGLDKVLAGLVNSIEAVIKLFGGKALANVSFGKVGIMKVSDNYHTLPKLVYLENGRIPANHRDLLSAKALYERYYYQDSLVADGQKLLYSGVEIPFNFSDFVKVLGNSYFYDNQSRICKFNSLTWNMSTSRATADYEVYERYTDNIEEIYNEQE